MPHTRRKFLGGAAAMTQVASVAAARPLGPNDRVQVGVIGCGARSHELMQYLMQAGGAEIVRIADAYQGRIERTLDRFRGRPKGASNYKEILEDKTVDAVMIVTPDHWHKQMVIDAVNASKDVYCEKPLTFRSAEGPEIIAAANRTKRIVQVGSQVCSSEVMAEAKRMIKAGKLGKVTMIRASYNRNTRSGAWLYPIPPDASPQTVDWEMFQGPAAKRPFSLERFFRWRCYSDYSGGIATDLFVHLCTTIHFLMDAKAPAKTMAMGQLYRWVDSRDVPDTMNAILEYPEGFVVNLSSTFNNQTSAESSFQLLGTEGSLELAGDLTFYPQRGFEDNRWIVESWPKRLEDGYYREAKVRAEELPSTNKPKLAETSLRLAPVGHDMSVTHLAGWIESIRTRKAHWEDAAVGHRAAACAHMVNQSIKNGRLVEWDFARDDVKAG